MDLIQDSIVNVPLIKGIFKSMQKYFTAKENKVACWINPRNFGAHEQTLIFRAAGPGDSFQVK
jgi:hypothetical protein